MKYIQKTFINFKETNELDNLSAWYVKHKVRRFLTSKTKVPLWVYRKINFISSMQDFYHLNDYMEDERAIFEWNRKDDYISITLPHLNEELIYLNGRLEHYRLGKLKNIYDKAKPDYKFNSYIEPCPTPKAKDKQKCLIGVDDLPISRMKDYTLYSYYKNLDKKECNIQHLAYLENLMIDKKWVIL